MEQLGQNCPLVLPNIACAFWNIRNNENALKDWQMTDSKSIDPSERYIKNNCYTKNWSHLRILPKYSLLLILKIRKDIYLSESLLQKYKKLN